MKAVSTAAAACLLGLASFAAHSKSPCDIHHLGYTQAQCDECSNMTWSVSRIFPRGTCVATTTPAPVAIGAAPTVPPATGGAPTVPPTRGGAPTVPPTRGGAPTAPAKMACDIHHLGYTQAQCDECSNMTWSVSRVFPRGTCVSTAPHQTLTIATHPAGASSGGGGAACTLTSWGGATIPLKSPNFSGTGVRVSVCSKGYDLAKSHFQCSTGVPVTAFNYPTTNVTCNKTTAVGGNPQVTINGQPCCLN